MWKALSLYLAKAALSIGVKANKRHNPSALGKDAADQAAKVIDATLDAAIADSMQPLSSKPSPGLPAKEVHPISIPPPGAV